jgi:hypothetical protein
VNEVERGVAHSGTAPKLVQQYGGSYQAATASHYTMSEVLARRLRHMDGDEFGTYIIYVQPGTPKDLFELDESTLDEYIQSAGDASAMTVEFKRREADGVLRQYAVGRNADEPGVKTVRWETNHSETVPAYEVFTADQAHPVYLQWCWDQTIPDGYRLRVLDI